MRHGLLAMFLAALLAGPAAAQPRPTDPARRVGIDQRLGERVPLDLVFRDETGREVRLGDYFAGKPVVLVLAQYRCPMLCNQVLNGLLESMRGVPFDLGTDYRVVTVSFDPRETPELAAAKKESYVEQYGRPGAAGGWHFLTGEQPAVEALAGAVGFRYAYDHLRDQYAHASGIMLLTPDGSIARYFYGIDYPSRDLRLGLVEASQGRIGSPVDQLLLLCYRYDAATGTYALVMNVMRLGAGVTVLVLGALLFRAFRRERGRGRAEPAAAR